MVKENIMENRATHITLILGVVIMVVTAIGSIAYYNIQKDNNMKSNIESAIVKGIDPLSVRCAYSAGYDQVCMAYALTHGKELPNKR
jgi:glucose uptake protein GlcU